MNKLLTYRVITIIGLLSLSVIIHASLNDEVTMIKQECLHTISTTMSDINQNPLRYTSKADFTFNPTGLYFLAQRALDIKSSNPTDTQQLLDHKLTFCRNLMSIYHQHLHQDAYAQPTS